MTKPKTSRTAWRIVAFLTIAVLGGAALLSCQFVSFNRRQSGLDDAVMLGNVGAVQDLLARGQR